MRYKWNNQSYASSVKLATVFNVFYLSSILLIVCVYTRCNTLFYTCILSVKQRRRRKKSFLLYLFLFYAFYLSCRCVTWVCALWPGYELNSKAAKQKEKNEENSKWIIKKITKNKILKENFPFFFFTSRKKEAEKCTHQ